MQNAPNKDLTKTQGCVNANYKKFMVIRDQLDA